METYLKLTQGHPFSAIFIVLAIVGILVIIKIKES